MFTHSSYTSCTACPRACRINRNSGLRAFCGENSQLMLAWAGLHFGEEPYITVHGGSGTLFVSGCNLRCTFCQNYQISQQGMGKPVSLEDFSAICLKLQDHGAENINIVTGSHAIPFLAEALRLSQKKGLSIPICWNSSAYETLEALELLRDVVAIWLPDLKTLNPLMSEELFAAKDYPKNATSAICWMAKHFPSQFKTVSDPVSGKKKKKMLSGVIVRHLVLPGRLNDTKQVLEWFSTQVNENAYISVMSQYTPVKFSESELEKRQNSLATFQNRFVNQEEFDAVQNFLADCTIEKGFFQELVQDSNWLPDFNQTNPFSSELAKTIWHWKTGFAE